MKEKKNTARIMGKIIITNPAILNNGVEVGNGKKSMSIVAQ